MRRRSNDPNRKASLIYEGDYGTWLNSFAHYIHSGHFPMNDIMWVVSPRMSDKIIAMDQFRYIEYVDLINISTKPFKKR